MFACKEVETFEHWPHHRWRRPSHDQPRAEQSDSYQDRGLQPDTSLAHRQSSETTGWRKNSPAVTRLWKNARKKCKGRFPIVSTFSCAVFEIPVTVITTSSPGDSEVLSMEGMEGV